MYLMPDTFKSAVLALLNEVPLNFQGQAMDDFIEEVQETGHIIILYKLQEKIEDLESDLESKDDEIVDLENKNRTLQVRVNELEAKV